MRNRPRPSSGVVVSEQTTTAHAPAAVSLLPWMVRVTLRSSLLPSTRAFLLIFFFSLLRCSALQLTPSTLPEDVVLSQLSALQEDDMHAVYRYASPNNRAATTTGKGGDDDVERFGRMVRAGPYRPLVRHRRSTILLESTMAESRQYLVRVTPGEAHGDGRVVAEYWWSLSRCRGGEFDGSYMVDAVIPNM